MENLIEKYLGEAEEFIMLQPIDMKTQKKMEKILKNNNLDFSSYRPKGIKINKKNYSEKLFKGLHYEIPKQHPLLKLAEAKGSSASKMECMECGHKFKKKLGKNTFEVKCPKCKGYDVEPA